MRWPLPPLRAFVVRPVHYALDLKLLPAEPWPTAFTASSRMKGHEVLTVARAFSLA
jgi:hypothetical protein